MDKYLEQTMGLLRLYQSIMSEAEMEKSSEAGTEIYESIREIAGKYQLNIHEMMNATLSCHATIIEAANEEINKVKEENAE